MLCFFFFFLKKKRWIWFFIQVVSNCFDPIKVKKILKCSQDSISSPSSLVKIQIMGKKFNWGVKAKHCWVLSTNFMPFLPKIWKMKVMGLNPGYLLKSFLLYPSAQPSLLIFLAKFCIDFSTLWFLAIIWWTIVIIMNILKDIIV